MSLFCKFLKYVQFLFFLGYITTSIVVLNSIRFLPDNIFQRLFYLGICGFNKCMNNKVITYGNIENLKQQNCIYICNHYDGVDFSIIIQLLTCPGFNTTYTISKSDLVIPHKYGKIADNKHINLLLFPEGEARKYGISVNFKPGIFKFAEKHNIPIIPITIYYKPFIGENKGGSTNIFLWLNNEVQVFVHDKIVPQDYNIMLKQSFDLISSTHNKMSEMS